MKNFPYPVPEGISSEKIRIKTSRGKIPILILKPEIPVKNAPCVLWIHGGGYILGMKEMVYIGRAPDLVKNFGATVVSPGYHLAFTHPYPTALEECYETLLYIKNHAKELDINPEKIIIGGESAGGGLCAALAMYARDMAEVNVAFQIPLYPMINNFDTESSKDNHGKVWNTRKNHFAWRIYLRSKAKKEVSPYASPSRQTDYSNLPPAYTFVGKGEPFYCETLEYIKNLNDAGIDAKVDVYDTDVHGFDMVNPNSELSKKAIENFNRALSPVFKNHLC